MRIAHFGTFDVQNFGDLLFPLILERRLQGVVDEIVHVSPRGSGPVWNDCVATIGTEEILTDADKLDGVVIGGGNIVRTGLAMAEGYRDVWPCSLVAYPRLWSAAGLIASRDDGPLIWNAPGVAGSFGGYVGELLRWVLHASAYISVRDVDSAMALGEFASDRTIDVVADTALDVSALWPGSRLQEAYKEAFQSRGQDAPERSVVLHLNRRYADGPIEELAARMDRIARRLQARPVLLAFGPCHGDDELATSTSERMASEALVVHPRSLREVVGLIAGASFYAGSSLHGMITAVSFDVPGAIVVTESPTGQHKFSGFLKQIDGMDRLARGWTELERDLDRLAEHVPGTPDARAAARSSLDRHWGSVVEILASERTTPAAARIGSTPYPLLAGAPELVSLIADGSRQAWLELHRLRARTESLTRERDEIRALRARANDDVSRLGQELTRANSEAHKLKREAQDAVRAVDAMRHQIVDLETQVHRLESQVATVTAHRDDVVMERHRLRALVRDLRSQRDAVLHGRERSRLD